MKNSQLAVVALAGMGLFALALSSPANADKNDKETCASKYPNAPTRPPRGYDYKNETDAYMAFRREARSAGFVIFKKGKREEATRGPCVDHGEHVNMLGRRASGKMDNIGALTGCRICEDTSRGPRLYRIVWRIHTKF